MWDGVVRDIKEATQGPDGIEQVHIARGIVGEDLRGVESPGTCLEDPVSPERKAHHICVKSPGKGSRGQPYQEGCGKQQDPEGLTAPHSWLFPVIYGIEA